MCRNYLIFSFKDHINLNIKNLLDIFEGTVEKRCAVYELADDEDDENQTAAECNAAKRNLFIAIEQLVHAHETQQDKL